MKKIYLKNLLGLLCLLLGFSASAQTTLTYDFEDEVPHFVSKSRCTVGVVDNEDLQSKVAQATAAHNAGNGYSQAVLDIDDPDIKKAPVVNISMKYFNNSGRGHLSFRDGSVDPGHAKASYGAAGTWFRLAKNSSSNILKINDTNTSDLLNKWLKLYITINRSERTVSYEICDLDDVVLYSGNEVAPYNADAAVFNQIELFDWDNNSQMGLIDDIEITYDTAPKLSAKIDFEDGQKYFKDQSRITSAIAKNDDLGSNAVKFTCAGNAQNGYSLSVLNLADIPAIGEGIAKADAVHISMKYYNTNGARSILSFRQAPEETKEIHSKTTYSATGAWFRIGSDKTYSFINGTNSALARFTNQWLDVDVNINVSDKKVSYTISKDGTVLESATSVDPFNGEGSVMDQIEIWGYINGSLCSWVDDINIEVSLSETPFANYTVQYLDESGNPIRDDAVREAEVGSKVSLTSADKETFYANNNKYFYVSDDWSEETVVAEDGSTLITVTFRTADVWDYTVNISANGEVFNTYYGSTFEEETVSARYPEYTNVDGTLYALAPINMKYAVDFVLDEPNKVVDIDGYEETDITEVIYLAEGEEIPSLTPLWTGNTAVRSSYCGSGRVVDEAFITTLEPGTYVITCALYDSHTSPSSEFTFTVNEKIVAQLTCTQINKQNISSQPFTLEEGGNLMLSASTSNNCGVDYIYIQQPSQSIAIDRTSLCLGVYESMPVVATIVNGENEETQVLWSSSDEDVARVSDDGIVTGVAEGWATIYAQYGAFKAACKVQVVEGKLDQIISWNQTIENVNVGDVITLLASASSGLEVKYEITAGQESATVEGDVLTVTGLGDFEITASQDGNIEYFHAEPVKLAVKGLSGVSDSLAAGLAIAVDGNVVTIANAPAGAVAAVYDITGRLVKATSEASFQLAQGVYIVKIAGKVAKVVVR